jgi:peptidoglycan/xylan/chitin deacetylase (PgdA/CDA1 family)
MDRRIRGLLGGRCSIWAVNYHQTLLSNSRRLESHFRWYSQEFENVGQSELFAFVDRGEWRHGRPGIIVTFDDGFRSNFEVAAPLLERFGLTGWFMVPSGFLDCPPALQREFAAFHALPGAFREVPAADGRVAMTWSEVQDLAARGHVIGCHTMTHRRLGPGIGGETLNDETAVAAARISRFVGRDVSSFAWVGGEPESYSESSIRAVLRAGFRFSLHSCGGTTHATVSAGNVFRNNVEDRWPVALAQMQLSSLNSLLTLRSRRRILGVLSSAIRSVASSAESAQS